MVDQWLYQQLMDINNKLTAISTKLDSVVECQEDQEERIRVLENAGPGCNPTDKWKYGGIGAGGGAGIAAAMYALIELVRSVM